MKLSSTEYLIVLKTFHKKLYTKEGKNSAWWTFTKMSLNIQITFEKLSQIKKCHQKV